MQQIKERGALPMIDRGDIRRRVIPTVAAISRLLLPGAGYGQFEHKADSLIAKFKEAGERSEIDEQSPRDYLRSGYLRIVCLSWAVNHYRDNAITYKAQRDKNARELKLANAALLTCRCRQRDVAALDAKYTEELLMLKLKMMLCVMMLPLVVVGCTSKQSVSQCVKPPPPPAWIMQPPRLADTAERDYFTLREADHYAKTAEGTQKYINERYR